MSSRKVAGSSKALPEGSPVIPPETPVGKTAAAAAPTPSAIDSNVSEAGGVEAPSPAIANSHVHHPAPRPKENGPGYRMPVVTPQERMAMSTEKHILDHPYDRMKTEELKWHIDRERGPENETGWWCYVCLCGPQPGPQPDPNEEWPGRKKKKVRRKDKGRKGRRSTVKRPVVPLKETEEVQNFRSAAVKALQESSGGFTPESATVLARNMGFVPSEADIERLNKQAPLDAAKFDSWVQSIAHTEDQDQEALVAAFKAADQASNGTISDFAFNHIMSEFGEALPANLASNLAEELGAKAGGKIKYREFVASLLASNRKLPPPESLSKLGIDPAKLPKTGVTEVTHFAMPPWSEREEDSECSCYSSEEDEETLDLSNFYTPVLTKCKPNVLTTRRPGGSATAAFWSKFH